MCPVLHEFLGNKTRQAGSRIGFRVSGLGLRVSGSEYRVWGLGFRV